MASAEEILVIFRLQDEISSKLTTIDNKLNGVLSNAQKGTNSLADSQTTLRDKGTATFNVLGTGMKGLNDNLNLVKGTFSQLFGVLGYGGVLFESISNGANRQTNQVMLNARRGVEEGNKLYNKIQDIVVALPGNDTFMTQFLAMSANMDTSIDEQDLVDIGGTIADYNAVAKAKGQLNNETEREIMQYMLTGKTRNLTNSLLAGEIDSLKNLSTITERATAMQKAMERTGWANMAHYKTFNNVVEEFRGRIERSFADIGTSIITILQPITELYNALDSILGNKLTTILVGGIGLFLGLIAIVTLSIKTFGFLGNTLLSIINISEGMAVLEGFTKKEAFVINFLTNSIDDEAQKLKIVNAIKNKSISTSIKKIATNIKEAGSNYLNSSSSIANASATDVDTASTELNTISKIKAIVVGKEKIAIDFLSKVYTNLKMLVTDKDTISILLNASAIDINILSHYNLAGAEALETQIKENSIAISILSLSNKIRETAQDIYHTIVKYEKIIVKKLSNSLEIVSITLSKLKSIATGKETVANLKSYASILSKMSAETAETRAKAYNNAITIVSITTKIKETAQDLISTIVKYGKLAVEFISISAKTTKIVATNSDTLSEINNTVAVSGNTIAVGSHVIALESDTTAEAINTALTSENTFTKIGNAYASTVDAMAKYNEATATELETISESENIFVKIKNISETIAQTIADGLKVATKWVSSASINVETVSEGINTDGKILNTLANIENIAKDILKIAIRLVQIPLTVALSVAEGVLTSELIAQAVAFMIATAPVWVLIGAIVGLIVVIEKIGEAFGWWSDFSSMLDAMWSGIMRIWDAFMNSAPIKSITNFIYTLETAINGIVQVLGVFWELLFPPSEDSGEWDIVGDIINFLSILGNIVYYASGLFIIFNILDAIGGAIGMMIDAWNLFLDSPLATEMFTALGEAFDELKAPFQEISQAFGEVFDAFGEIWEAIFGPSEDGEKQFNPFIELIKGFAQFIINYVVPAIKVIATIIRVLLIPLRVVAFVLQSIAGIIGMIVGATQTGAGIINNAINSIWQFLKPVYDAIKWIVDSASGVWEFLTGTKADGGKEDKTKSNNKPNPKSPKNLPTGNLSEDRVNQMKQQTQRNRTASWLGSTYHNQSNNSHTIVNNNFGDGSIPIDARNMTQKEAERTIQSGLGGYLNARRVTNK